MAVTARTILKSAFLSAVPRRTLLIAALLIAFFAMWLYYFLSAMLSPDLPATTGQSTVTMKGIKGQGERGTQIGWQFSADSSDVSADGMVTTYHNVRAGTYYLDGKPAYRLTAGTVTLDTRTQNYVATGGVHVHSLQPRAIQDLQTQTLTWNNPLQTLTCPETVRVLYKGYALVTSRLSANFANGSSSLGATSIKSNG
ncbi:MAG: hypothetical protein DLM53_02775 [Candidatus Eremiobacter antarcticus]|nr:LPS export ABC transporter periplasmic protein LptC [Candidatus Eremiobacteraeota bacterium]MBC5808335.1 LPS export ABC transporter periplasmic protein LptC [Candidatus Eremiobacteraeota bacterium]PZR63703.1 MAG: hypothetical protein DLM53_02775 [Candidatus Eremiobacter sp. RRmetagenome_bin22]